MSKSTWLKIGLTGGLIVGISLLHYLTDPYEMELHAVHQRLYYLPLVLGSFWFGIKGAAAVSISVIALYSPYVIYHWQGTFHDFETLLEGGLFVFIALTLGFLVESQKKEHAARIEAERLAAIGRVVSEIAHDMKSPLMAIGGFASQVSRNLPEDADSNNKLQIVIQETRRLEAMVKEMLEFGKPIELVLSRTDLNELAEKTAEALEPVASKEGVKLKIEPDRSLPAMNLDGAKLRQVLTNLITNAIQACAAGEEVLVRTRSSDAEALVEITDQGCGISEEDREKIFQPFFSTKKQGTGLGLANVKRIVEAQGGKVTFHPNKDKGTTFVITVPLDK
ncbi:ATP-binding protein [Desulfonatronospira sp.]|uniref:sensor histidine kinase n=1 Tax=Desulfonatronospira sp. TaxID=1962951 RepID=UPI0025C3E530|nr:ATP-binding protein [Desulfonatronospira sp.]